MQKWLDITNFISRYIKEKLNKGTTFLTIIENRTKRNAFFTKIHVLDISLGLKLPELKVHAHVASKNIKKLTDISFLQACLSHWALYIWRKHANLSSVKQLKQKTWRISDELWRQLTQFDVISMATAKGSNR